MKNYLLFALLCLLSVGAASGKESPHQRLIVLTDIEADPDDTQSLVRLLLYSNEIDIEGIIATTSTWKKDSISPDSIRKVIRAYGEVQPNLLLHDSAYPPADKLMSEVKNGVPRCGMEGVGEDWDTEGSDWIIKALDADDPRPLWISVWGGVNTLAQALYRLEQTRSEEELNRLIEKLRVYTISDQDDSGYWIRERFPKLFYIVTPGDQYGRATWTAIHTQIDGIDNRTVSNGWLEEHIQQGHGALGACYPDVAYGMEGDTPSWLMLIPNGLNAPEHPNWGGWGGRYEYYLPDYTGEEGVSDVQPQPETRPIWTNASDSYSPYAPSEYRRAVKKSGKEFTGALVTLWRWRDDLQNDFAARMDWCVLPYEKANHPPVPKLKGADEITVKSGQSFNLDASDSYDPDGDSLSFLWFNYPEAGTYGETIPIASAENLHEISVRAPEVDAPETVHFVLKLSDKGEPTLSRYKRVIVHIQP